MGDLMSSLPWWAYALLAAAAFVVGTAAIRATIILAELAMHALRFLAEALTRAIVVGVTRLTGLSVLALMTGFDHLFDRNPPAPPPPADKLDAKSAYDDALAVLGLKPGVKQAEFEAGLRKVLMAIHPDHGGTDWMLRQVIDARETIKRENNWQ